MKKVSFQVGGPISPNSSVYIVRKADQEMLEHLQQMHYVQLTEPRQQGKTSLISRLRDVLHNISFQNKVFILIYVDASSLPRKKGEPDWYRELSERILVQLQDFIHCQNLSLPEDGKTWRAFLSDLVTSKPHRMDIEPQIIIALDEVGSVPYNWAEDFFRILREIYNLREIETSFQRVSFILAGTFDPRDLIQDKTISPFNVAQAVNLEDLSLEQVNLLISKLSLPDTIADSVTQHIYHWTEGQPYLTQKLCFYLAEHGDHVTLETVNIEVNHFFQEDTSHLPRIIRYLENEPDLIDALRRIYRNKIRFAPAVNPLHFRLARIVGVIKRDGDGFCQIRNPIYKRALKEAGFIGTKILILAANPEATSHQRLDEEVREIENSLQQSQNRARFELKAHWATRPQEVSQAILDFQPDIVHFGGHEEETAIVFESNTGELRSVSDEALAGLFELFADTVECVLLNACYSISQAEAIAQHVKYVIGINAAIGDNAAIEFAVAFYDALGAGQSVEFAYKLACNAIQMIGVSEHLLPVLLPKGEKDTLSRADKFYELGFDYFQNNEFEDARNYLSKSLSLNPAHVDATLLLGRIYFDREQFQQSIEMLEQAYQYNKIKSRSLLLQSLKSEADRTGDITLHKRIQNILEDQLKNIQGDAILEVELFNRSEDLIWQDELVLKFQIKNKGNVSANNVSVKISQGEAYKLVNGSLFSVNFINPGDYAEADFLVRPLQDYFACSLFISYTDKLGDDVKELRYEQSIRLSRQQKKTFKRIRNPYQYATLSQELGTGKTDMFFGRGETMQDLKETLIDDNKGLVIIYGQRRTGKTCLMKYMQQKQYFGSDFPVIFSSMQGFSSDQEFYHDILRQVGGLTTSSQNIDAVINSFGEFKDLLTKSTNSIDTSIVLMLDEFEFVTDRRFSYTTLQDADDFIRKMRNLIEHATKIKFMLSGADRLRTMLNDHNNPLFNAGLTFSIAALRVDEARSLITKPLKEMVGYTEQAIQTIQDVTANHPHYIQLLCHRIITILNSEKRSYEITITHVDRAIESIEKPDQPDFKFVWDTTTKEAHLILSVLAEEMATPRTWLPIDRIEQCIKEQTIPFQKDVRGGPIKELKEKNLIAERGATLELEYIIPMGLLRTWIKRYKPLKLVRREFT